MKSQLTVAIALLIACFAFTTTVHADAVLVVHTDTSPLAAPGTMEIHVGDTSGSFPDASNIVAMMRCDNATCVAVAPGPVADQAGGGFSVAAVSIESASGGIVNNLAQALPVILAQTTGGFVGTAVFQNTSTLYAETVNVGNPSRLLENGTVYTIGQDITGAQGPRWDTSAAMDLKFPFPAQAVFGAIAYIGIVPEPTSVIMLLTGLGMVLAVRRRS